MRILWHGVAPFVKSGYGNLTKNIALRISQRYPLLVSCYYGLHFKGSIVINGTKIYPACGANYGEREVKHFIEKFKITLPIIASDFWPFPWFAQLPNSMFYGPIDSFDYIEDDYQVMKTYSHFIPCSKFGAKVYKRVTGRNPKMVIPHGVDVNVFKPYNKLKCRKFFSFPKRKFIFGIVAANNDPEPRKGWDDLLISLSEFLKRNPGEKKKIFVFAFTNPRTDSGYDLPKLVKKLGLKDIVRFPELLPQIVGLPDQEMAMLYSTFDLFLSASRREGFNIPLLEAQACGVPVVASNTSAHTELVKGHGWLVKMGETVFAPRGWKCQKVDREDLVKKIEDAYFSERKRKIFREKSLKFARQFDWEKLFREKWIPLLESLSSQSLNIISSS